MPGWTSLFSVISAPLAWLMVDLLPTPYCWTEAWLSSPFWVMLTVPPVPAWLLLNWSPLPVCVKLIVLLLAEKYEKPCVMLAMLSLPTLLPEAMLLLPN